MDRISGDQPDKAVLLNKSLLRFESFSVSIPSWCQTSNYLLEASSVVYNISKLCIRPGPNCQRSIPKDLGLCDLYGLGSVCLISSELDFINSEDIKDSIPSPCRNPNLEGVNSFRSSYFPTFPWNSLAMLHKQGNVHFEYVFKLFENNV